MPTYIDDEAVELQGDRLGVLLVAAQERLEPTGRVIVEVAIDGNVIVGEELAAREDDAVGETEIRLLSADPRELAALTLQQVGQELEGATEAQASAADLLRQDQPTEAMELVGQAIEVWMYTAQAVLHATEMLDIDLDHLEFDGQLVPAMTGELIEQLKVMRGMLEAGDTVSLADALAYEWPQTTQRWQRLIEHMLELIPQQPE